MKILLFGATGMVGQGVLRECLLDPEVERVLVVGRSETGQRHEKLTELVHRDFTDLSTVEARLSGYDACFFCLGVSSAGMKEPDYRRVTYDYTLAAARTLARLNPGMTFIYVSGAGTDSTAKGRVMWARVKGETENALFQLPFKAAYMFRPGFIQPMHGVTSKTPLYRALYGAVGPLSPILKRLFPGAITTTERVGLAMLRVAKQGAPQRLLENQDINALAAA
ncbi:NAD(P)H-binding protein [Cystobacter ferrugineus]|uniref:Epimerase n=1 Tax=Cystobacter ferrugineus TaxID=83449 RepID=A0A1L9BCG1_9BACT|nr:NAD(P)H-binding protein [Cystobacter ferrugineus]OJH39926.1 epimerase [Cystobacter ferrugineus]